MYIINALETKLLFPKVPAANSVAGQSGLAPQALRPTVKGYEAKQPVLTKAAILETGAQNRCLTKNEAAENSLKDGVAHKAFALHQVR